MITQASLLSYQFRRSNETSDCELRINFKRERKHMLAMRVRSTTTWLDFTWLHLTWLDPGKQDSTNISFRSHVPWHGNSEKLVWQTTGSYGRSLAIYSQLHTAGCGVGMRMPGGWWELGRLWSPDSTVAWCTTTFQPPFCSSEIQTRF